ncbi:conserved Plasmodium protein, unknown function [Plasmodium vinckei lentum]|uniref:Uncharacterized protein n=1 Tax=Plasmodium vinckei lentum TaxID=138297 RepID=A0A6V7RWS6_PLAVN|nr:conserved Plasmodium protein, unknown function [Plasmodium vinckei lentum]
MLENLCIDLLHELFKAKYNLLLSLQTNLHTKRERKKKKKKRDKIFRYLFIRVLEKDEYYTHFGYIKKKKIMRKKKIKKEYKKLRKHIADINTYYKKSYSKSLKNEYSDNYCTSFNEYHTHTLLKSIVYNPKNFEFILRKKWNISTQNKIISYKHKINDYKKRKRSVCIYYCRRNREKRKQKHNYKNYNLFTKNKKNNVIFNKSNNINEARDNDDSLQLSKNSLYTYLDKHFYSILPNFDFKQLEQEEEANLEKNNNLNYILNIEKMKNNLIKKNKIRSKVYVKNKKHIYLSSTKLNKQYINFLDDFHLLIKKMKIHKERDLKIINSTNLKLLKTILYLENNYNDIDSTNSSNSSDVIKSVLVKKKNYKICHIISIINYIKKSLYIIKMDIMYIFIFFTSYINNIFAKLKNSQ